MKTDSKLKTISKLKTTDICFCLYSVSLGNTLTTDAVWPFFSRMGNASGVCETMYDVRDGKKYYRRGYPKMSRLEWTHCISTKKNYLWKGVMMLICCLQHSNFPTLVSSHPPPLTSWPPRGGGGHRWSVKQLVLIFPVSSTVTLIVAHWWEEQQQYHTHSPWGLNTVPGD